MKKLLLLFIPLVFFFSCEEEENSDTNNNMGYDCTANGCIGVLNGEYTTLEECANNCDFWSFKLEITDPNNSQTTFLSEASGLINIDDPSLSPLGNMDSGYALAIDRVIRFVKPYSGNISWEETCDIYIEFEDSDFTGLKYAHISNIGNNCWNVMQEITNCIACIDPMPFYTTTTEIFTLSYSYEIVSGSFEGVVYGLNEMNDSVPLQLSISFNVLQCGENGDVCF